MNKKRTKETKELKLIACILVILDYIMIVTIDLFLLSFSCILCSSKNKIVMQEWANNIWSHCIS